MKKLSDYKGDDAIELWGDLLGPLTVILGDKEISSMIRSGKPRTLVAQAILKNHKIEAEQFLLRIDPEPITGLNIVTRLLSILADIGSDDEIKSFFISADQVVTENESIGSATENTEVSES